MPTHKKGHDKDKYYHLAKDQGFRSRAAFKLIQINKKFDFLSKAKVCIDLCAAPGGWCQVAAKAMPQGSLVLGIDLLQIPAIRNVKTLVADITTAECRRMVVSELQGWKADVVLCDGAPNIGSAYSKDAYVQNELVIAALKTATDHLVEGGTFCTKVYRSTDYTAIVWCLQQLFEDVQTVKPNSSRSQSSEIFLVCLKYTAPSKIDPKLLDPNHLFKEVADPGLRKVDVMHKKYEQSNKRSRSGYDEGLGPLLENKAQISQFVLSEKPIQMLTDVNMILFDEEDKLSQKCLAHPKTTEEIKTCLTDLRVLGKIDFKKILKWRQLMIDSFITPRKEESEELEKEAERRAKGKEVQTEEGIQTEIRTLRQIAVEADKKNKKKSREEARKLRDRQALGMTNNAFEVQGDMELFTMNPDTTMDEFDDVADVNLSHVDHFDGYKSGEASSDDDDQTLERKRLAKKREITVIEQNDMDDELEEDYVRFLSGRRARSVEELREVDEHTTPSLKKTKQKQESKNKISKVNEEDEELLNMAANANRKGKADKNQQEDLENYVALLNGGTKKTERNSKKEIAMRAAREGRKVDDVEAEMASADSSDDDSEDDGFEDSAEDSNDNTVEVEDEDDDDDGSDSEEGEDDDKVAPSKKKKRMIMNDDKALHDAKVGRWFTQPIFGSGLMKGHTEDANSSKEKSKKEKEKEKAVTARVKSEAERERDMVSMMPKTDKEMRQAKRKKDVERRERQAGRKEERVQADMDATDARFGFGMGLPEGMRINGYDGDAAGENTGDSKAFDDRDGKQGVTLSADDIARRELIKKGLGAAGKEKVNGKELQTNNFEVVPAVEPFADNGQFPPVKDNRQYDSDNEEYDSHDRATTLALGTMMLRHSKKKALVDASYNRYAFSDAKNMPSWFQDDEMRHNKPQLPIPAALMEQIKSRFQMTGTKEIKKVAEARMRKRKRAMTKLKAAKKQATVVAGSAELSERQKLKAISKAMKTSKVDKPGKVYVRQTKNGQSATSGKKGGKVKYVDARMKKDTRAAKVKEKKGKKKRRHTS